MACFFSLIIHVPLQCRKLVSLYHWRFCIYSSVFPSGTPVGASHFVFFCSEMLFSILHLFMCVCLDSFFGYSPSSLTLSLAYLLCCLTKYIESLICVQSDIFNTSQKNFQNTATQMPIYNRMRTTFDIQWYMTQQ